MSNIAAKLSMAAALLGIGGLSGAAIAARPVDRPATVAATPAPQPVEIRTIVRHRTVHVYRKPKRRRPVAPAVAPVPAPIAPAPARVVAAPAVRTTAPVRPLQTRTSGSGHGREDDHEEHEGGDD